MMKKMLRDQKAISLITLSITVIVLVIVTNVIIYNLQDNLGLERLRNMQNDIENLRAKVDLFYAQNGIIPKIDIEYTNTNSIKDLISVNDTGKFYVINLSDLENLTLTYGEDYRNVETVSDVNTLEDIYIINEASHNIFYVKGITLDGEQYYTDYTKEDVDSEKVEIKYVDGIKIPEGFVYESGTSAEDLVVALEDGTLKYSWVSVEEKITVDTCPTATNSSDLSTEDLVDSINRYKGYYYCEISGGTTKFIKYIKIEDNWSPTYDMKSEYTDKNGDTAYIPAGFQVSRVPSSDTIDEGLVVRNATTDDRFVWIEVPKSIFKTATSSEDYINIEKDMQDYASEYRDENYTDTWNDGCGINSEDEYNELKNKMLKSVYENGGFWISQYEIGVDEPRTSGNVELKTAISKKGEYPYNHVTCAQAQQLATDIDSGEHTTSLLFGVQWDLVLKFIETQKEKTQEELKEDSNSWGNFYSAKFEIVEGEYATDKVTFYEVTDSYTKDAEVEALLTTGATKRNRALNIYDLAGNVWEWTLEMYKNNTSNSYRGGDCVQHTGEYNVSSRQHQENIENSVTGFRVALY